MKNLIIKLFGQIFYDMGVSEADLSSYLDACMKYIWIILIALIVLIVILVAAHWCKKGTKAFTRLTGLVAFLLAAALSVNSVLSGPLKETASTMLTGSKVELQESTIADSKDVIKKVGEEGIVLLKNDDLLPLSDTENLNVFGWASTNPILGGTGSGSSDSASAVWVLPALADAGFKTNEDLSKIYTDYRADRPTIAMQTQDWTLPEPTVDVYTDEVMSAAKEFSDTAVIVISRSGGEGADLPTDMNAVIKGTYDIAEQVSVAPTRYGYYRSLHQQRRL
jgi:beta-glucosidase